MLVVGFYKINLKHWFQNDKLHLNTANDDNQKTHLLVYQDNPDPSAKWSTHHQLIDVPFYLRAPEMGIDFLLSAFIFSLRK